VAFAAVHFVRGRHKAEVLAGKCTRLEHPPFSISGANVRFRG
jgi:hypothetical protein